MDITTIASALATNSAEIKSLTTQLTKVEISISSGIEKLNENLENILKTQQEHAIAIHELQFADKSNKSRLKWFAGVGASVLVGAVLLVIKILVGG